MNDREILHKLAALNPVRDEPSYDEAAERRLVGLLETVRAEAAPASPSVRPIASHTVRRAPRWGPTVSITAVLAVAVVILAGGIGGRQAPKGKPPDSAVTHIDTHGLVADRTIAALSASDDYIVRADEVETDPSGAVFRSITSTDEQSAVNFADVEYSSGGAPGVQETDFAVGGAVVVRKLDNQARQYMETRLTMLQYARRFGFGSVADLERSSVSTSKQIRRDLMQGRDRLLGSTRLNGRRVLVLASNEPGMRRRLWIDPGSYLPIRMTAQSRGMSYVINYTWLTRTKQSIAATFAPRIPPGFTKVSHLPGS